jgi:ABC-type Mn2+/Zn2+ transport system ATPase subunit
MAAEELDLKAQYDRKVKVLPTVTLYLEEGKLLVITGPHPVHSEEYVYDWDTEWNEPGTDVIAVRHTVEYSKTVTNPICYVNRVIDDIQNDDLGQWLIDVLNGKDPR